MSVKVNLLPGDVAKGAKVARSRNMVIAGAAVAVVAMGGIFVLQLGAVRDAEARLAAVEATNVALRANVGELAPFAQIELRQNDALAAVQLAMVREASLAGVLQDLSAVLPPGAEINALTVAVEDAPSSPAPGGGRVVEGRLTAQGRVLVGIAPGVERLITDVERAAAFNNVFVGLSSVDEDDVSTFSLEVDLGSEILTHRYQTGGVVPQ